MIIGLSHSHEALAIFIVFTTIHNAFLILRVCWYIFSISIQVRYCDKKIYSQIFLIQFIWRNCAPKRCCLGFIREEYVSTVWPCLQGKRFRIPTSMQIQVNGFVRYLHHITAPKNWLSGKISTHNSGIFRLCWAVEPNSYKFGKHTMEQSDLNYFWKGLTMEVIFRPTISRTQRFHKLFRIWKFRIYALPEMILYRICSVNGEMNPISNITDLWSIRNHLP